MKRLRRRIQPLLFLLAALLLCGCTGTEKPVSTAKGSAQPPLARTSAPAATPSAVAVQRYASDALALSLEYPADWSVQENGSIIVLAAPQEQDRSITLADITQDISLMLAAHGDLGKAAEIVMKRHATALAGRELDGDYQPRVAISTQGEVSGGAEFGFRSADGEAYRATMKIAHVGGRVMLDCFARRNLEGEEAERAQKVYLDVEASLLLRNTDQPLAAAEPWELGFPAPPQGCTAFYNQVSGQYLYYPADCKLYEEDKQAGDEKLNVILKRDRFFLITTNWTERYNEVYAANGGDLVACMDAFAQEQFPFLIRATDSPNLKIAGGLKLQEPSNEGEIIKGTFLYSAVGPKGIKGTCFAELAIRSSDGIDYVQGTLVLFGVHNFDKESIDSANSIIQSTAIRFFND